jgi:hypothetical protein
MGQQVVRMMNGLPGTLLWDPSQTNIMAQKVVVNNNKQPLMRAILFMRHLLTNTSN